MDASDKNPKRIVIDGSTDVIILDESTGVTDRTRRPITGERRKALQEQLAKQAELAKLAEEYRQKLANGEVKLPPGCIVIDSEVVILDESTGVTDRTRKPVTGARLQALKERLAKEAEWRKLMDEERKKNGTEPPQS